MKQNSDLFLNHTWLNAQWGALNTEILDVNLFAFAYRLFHENFSQERNLHEHENIFLYAQLGTVARNNSWYYIHKRSNGMIA